MMTIQGAYAPYGVEDEQYEEISDRTRCSWVGRTCSKMRILFVPVMATHVTAAAVLGYLTEVFAHPLEKEPSGAPTPRLIAIVSVDATILVVSIVAETIYCRIRRSDRECPRLVAPPPLLITAALAGMWGASLELYQKANQIYENYQNDDSAWQAEYKSLYDGCLANINTNSSFFTASACTSCLAAGNTVTEAYDELIQAVVQRGINMTLCGIPLHANQIDANETIDGQEWPCGGIFTSHETTTFEEPFLIAIGEQFNLHPPMILQFSRFNESCGLIEGFATNLYDVTALCRGVNGTHPTEDNRCATPYMIEYFSDYQRSLTVIEGQQPFLPNGVVSIINSSENITLFYPLGAMLFFSILYFVFDLKLKRKPKERQPLLIK